MKSYIRAVGTANHQPEILDFMFKIVGTVAQDAVTHLSTSILPLQPAPDAAVVVNSGITQAQIDSLLTGNAAVAVNNDVLATAFGGTRLGTDSVGFILALEGNVRDLLAVEVISTLTNDAVSVWRACQPTGSALTDALPTALAFEKSAAGNVYGSATITGLDAASAGFIHLRVICRLK